MLPGSACAAYLEHSFQEAAFFIGQLNNPEGPMADLERTNVCGFCGGEGKVQGATCVCQQSKDDKTKEIVSKKESRCANTGFWAGGMQ